ncbi:MAG: 3-dehydroquinate synthase [Armatimonadetes bacterium]|nr:3-dehydroquinate synthase [Armatimonadota bacterium]
MRVNSSRGSYDVSFESPEEILRETLGAYVVTDTNLAGAWPNFLEGREALVIEPGEGSKTMEVTARILGWLAQRGARRDAVVVAFGGGVIGDLAGFAAATYMRGVRLHMVPTSLLAMVDSSVGGKVGVDLKEGKNLAGAFWPPDKVSISTEFLGTLPQRELLCGSAEVWKYGFIMDEPLLSLLESQPIVPRDGRMEDLVARCVELKAAVVEEDEFETTGRRAILNFGHTIGHALEACLGYGTWTHGEAISVGMVCESRLGETLGLSPKGTAERVRKGLASQGLPVDLPQGLEADEVMAYLARDKKNTAEGVSFSLLTAVGKCKLVTGVMKEDVQRVLRSA